MIVLNYCYSPKTLREKKQPLLMLKLVLLQHGVVATANVVEACKDVNIAIMLGGYPWKEIKLRKETTQMCIYKPQALALEEHDAVDCKGAFAAIVSGDQIED